MMITEEDCERFMGKKVAVGVDDWNADTPKSLFWYFGNLIEIVDGTLKVNTRDGFLVVNLSDVREIKIVED